VRRSRCIQKMNRHIEVFRQFLGHTLF
jgi:hypothetical protein